MVRLFCLTVVVGILVCFGNAATADDPTAKDYVEFMKPLVGTWKATIESAGQVVEGTWDVRLARGGFCLTTVTTGLAPATQSIDGYDPVAKKWTALMFNAAGEHIYVAYDVPGVGKGKVFSKGVVIASKRKTSKSDGTIVDQTSKMTCTECLEQKIVVKWSDVKVGEEAMPDRVLTLERQEQKRRGERPEIDVPEIGGDRLTTQDYVKYLRPFQGSWKTKVEVDGQDVEGTWRGRVSPTGACFLTGGDMGIFPTFQSIDGYDPATGCWTVGSFNEEGDFTLGTLKLEGVKKGDVIAPGATGLSKRKEFKADGTTIESTSQFTVTKCNEKEVAYKLTKLKVDGEVQPDSTFSMERVPRRRRTDKQ